MPRSSAARRRRRTFLVVVVVVVGLVAWFVASSFGSPPPPSSAGHGGQGSGRTPGTTDAGTQASLVAQVARWHLPGGVSRAGAVPIPGGKILLLGGLLSTGGSSADVGVLDPSTGTLTSVATLASRTHDAASALLGGRAFLFGGGQSTPFGTVEAVTVPSPGATSGNASGVVTGQLPQARADDSAVTVGTTAYVVGGYDGATGEPAVLATQDGSTFTTVATLPVDVRYGAVVAAGGKIFVFGGESATGGTTAQYFTPTGSTTPPPGQEVAVAQEIDPQTGAATVVGYLPHAVQGAAAFVLGGHIYLAGGDSNAPGASPASGSTIWSFDPSSGAFQVAGHLAEPVAYAAVAVVGHSVWLIGGERNGTQVDTAQKVVLRSSH